MDDREIAKEIQSAVEAVREAFWLQATDQFAVAADPIQALHEKNSGIQAVAVDMLLRLAALAFRYQVWHALDCPRHVKLSALLEDLTHRGKVSPKMDLELLGDALVWAASAAGGVQPPVQPLLDKHLGRPVLAAAWITARTALEWASEITLTPASAVAQDVLGDFPTRA